MSLENFELIKNLINVKVNVDTPVSDFSKYAFLKSLPSEVVILDVGCGNNSPFYTKNILPNCHYIGLDIGDYNMTENNLADEYIITTPNDFGIEIYKKKSMVNAVISSHNLEHCDDRVGILRGMAQSLKNDGLMYLSFPCQDSVHFKYNRNGCLNYYDDNTHKLVPPNFGEVINILVQENMQIIYASSRYQNPLQWIEGLFNEDESKAIKETLSGTWALWGFETVIWARMCNI